MGWRQAVVDEARYGKIEKTQSTTVSAVPDNCDHTCYRYDSRRYLANTLLECQYVMSCTRLLSVIGFGMLSRQLLLLSPVMTSKCNSVGTGRDPAGCS